MFGQKYYLNPETLRYERVRLPKKQRIRVYCAAVIGIGLLSVGMRYGFEKQFVTPRQQIYEVENQNLRAEYVHLNQTLQSLESDLAGLAHKDDRFYRSILSLDPIPSTQREAGTGGAQRNQELRSIREPGMILSVTERMQKLSSKLMVQSSSLESVYREALTTQQYMACRPSINPISPADPCWMTSSYGFRNDPFTHQRTAHHGIDLAGPYGLDIHCTGDGVVRTSCFSRHGYGNEVIIDHGFGYISIYAHLQDIHVKKGQKVKRGEVLGTMGNTGRSTGPHLHYEIRKDGRTVNPMYFFDDDLSPEEYSLMASRVVQEKAPYQPVAFSQK